MIDRIRKRRSEKAAARPRAGFRERYREAEQHRAAMLERLQKLSDEARSLPAYRRALVLLNPTFRNAKIAQRAAILQAAEWLINLLETLTIMA